MGIHSRSLRAKAESKYRTAERKEYAEREKQRQLGANIWTQAAPPVLVTPAGDKTKMQLPDTLSLPLIRRRQAVPVASFAAVPDVVYDGDSGATSQQG